MEGRALGGALMRERRMSAVVGPKCTKFDPLQLQEKIVICMTCVLVSLAQKVLRFTDE